MKRIRKRDLLKLFLRSFYIQATWNFERMLGLGLCFCLIPIAKRLYSTKEEMIDFLQRNLDFFNAHPYMASYAIGSLARLEEQAIQQNWSDKKPIAIFRERLCGPLGALGDTLFWQLIKPLSACVGVIVTLFWGWVGIFASFIVYNIFHFYIRSRGIYMSYKKGFDIIRDLSIRGTQKYVTGFRISLNICTGFMFGAFIYWIAKKYYLLPNFPLILDKRIKENVLQMGVSVKAILFFLLITTLAAVLNRTSKLLSVGFTIVIILMISITFGLMIV
jgi:mannose/fructose/N-acetylgalactosamine-specific phosphotransferase system component IID